MSDEPIAEDDGELGPGLEPFARRPFPFVGLAFKTRYSSFIAASSLGKCPRVRTARRSLAFSASIGLVTGMRMAVPISRRGSWTVAYGATIRDRGTGSTKVWAGRFLNVELRARVSRWPPLQLARLR